MPTASFRSTYWRKIDTNPLRRIQEPACRGRFFFPEVRKAAVRKRGDHCGMEYSSNSICEGISNGYAYAPL
jgi:hypothetical protein